MGRLLPVGRGVLHVSRVSAQRRSAGARGDGRPSGAERPATPRCAAELARAEAAAAAGDLGAALLHLRAATALEPARAEAWHNLGVVCARRGDMGAAGAAFATAARLRPGWAEPHYAAGHVGYRQGDYAAAERAFENALACDPGHLAARVDLAQALLHQRRPTAAAGQLMRARAAAPADEAIWWLLRGALLLLRRDEDALADWAAFARSAAAARVPASARMKVAALASAGRGGERTVEAGALAAVLEHRFVPGESQACAEALALVQYHDVEPAALRALYAGYDELMAVELGFASPDASPDGIPIAPPHAMPIASPAATPASAPTPAPGARRDRRLRIGYLSADFRGHVMGELMQPVLAAHDRARVHVTLFSLAPSENADPATARFRAHADHFVELADRDDAAAATLVAAARLDVLVDLMAHSAFARPGILARRPAPRIVTHLGAHGGVGLSSVDWKLTDRVADLPDGAGALRERLLVMDGCVLPLRPFAPPPARYSRDTLDIPRNAPVLAAFVGVQKLAPRCIDVWRRVLERVPDAILLFSPPAGDERAAIVRRLSGFGVPPARVAFVPFEPSHRTARYALADLVLDTLPYTGGDTTASALAAGVPVVTRCGRRHAERMGASILTHAGLADLVTGDDSGFVDLACRLLADPAARAAVAARVRAAFADPALTDPARYAAALERALERAAERAAEPGARR